MRVYKGYRGVFTIRGRKRVAVNFNGYDIRGYEEVYVHDSVTRS